MGKSRQNEEKSNARQPLTVQNGVTICGYNYDCMKNKTKILLVVTADILVFAIILLSFAWFHHVKPQKFDANHAFPLPEKRENLLHGKYEDKFTADGSIQKPRIPIAAAMYPLRF